MTHHSGGGGALEATEDPKGLTTKRCLTQARLEKDLKQTYILVDAYKNEP
jgi:hypothetical protein